MKLEVILAVYNHPEVTRLTLEGYTRQTDHDFLLTIADDGSGPEIKALLDEFAGRLTLRHLWQEDRGFRKSRCLNRAIASSEADYLIFSDNDCIPSRHFVADHRRAATAGCFVTGRRVDLGPIPTEEVLSGRRRDPESLRWVIVHSLKKHLKRGEKAFRPPYWIHRLWSRKQIGTLGANMAMWRNDLLKVNGFDEDYEGYGMEETDLEWRLLKAGVERRAILGRGLLFHLYHPVKKMTEENRRFIAAKREGGILYAINGIEKPAIAD